MQDSFEENRTLRRAQEKYESAKRQLEGLKDDPSAFQSAAQQANDAWLEFKRTQNSIEKTVILKRMGDLYGC